LFEVLELGVGTMFTGMSLIGTVIVIIVFPDVPVPGPGATGSGALSSGPVRTGGNGTGVLACVLVTGSGPVSKRPIGGDTVALVDTRAGPVFNGPIGVIGVGGTGTGAGFRVVILYLLHTVFRTHLEKCSTTKPNTYGQILTKSVYIIPTQTSP